MHLLGKQTEITQAGQAIHINATATSALSQLFASSIGPYGRYKLLISAARQLTITKTGSTMIDSIKFTHPSSHIVNKAARQHCDVIGDGTSTLVVLSCELFRAALQAELSVHRTIRELRKAMGDAIGIVNDLREPVSTERVVYHALSTKMQRRDAKRIAAVLCEAVRAVEQNEFCDLNLIEVVRMEGPADVRMVRGLVLDHAGRHPLMPTRLQEARVLVTNMSMEYERPEVNAEFLYSSAAQRESLAESERQFVLDRVRSIVSLAQELQARGQSLLVVSEGGMDPFAMELLSGAGILGLRRAKRRNLERLVKVCGGNVVTRVEELREEALGYAGTVRVVSQGDEKFTFVEGVPFGGACTLVVTGRSMREMKDLEVVVKNTLKTIDPRMIGSSSAGNNGMGYHLPGGTRLYEGIIRRLSDSPGHLMVKNALQALKKILVRNGVTDEEVYDNYAVMVRVLQNACVVAINLLMIDEIISAGKSVKDEGNNSQ